jgi:hypothetical protein
MNILRKLAVSLCAALLSLSLFSAAWSQVAVSTIHNKDTVKGWFQKSGFYDEIADVVLEKIKDDQTSTQDKATEQIPVNDPQIQSVVKSILTPAFLQKNVETLLDSSYGWLNGTAPKLDFSIDLTSAKQQLAASLGEFVKNRVDGLSVCAGGEASSDFDGFNATCRPSGVTGASIGAKISNDILTGDFLKNPVLTPNDIKVDDGKGNKIALSDSKEGDAVRKTYRLGGYAPLLIFVFAVLMALGVIFISRERLVGLRRVGYTLAITGAGLLVTYLVIHVLANALNTKLSETATMTAAQRNLLTNVIRVISGDVNRVLGYYAGGYLIGGIGMIVVSSIVRKKRGPQKQITDEQPLGNPELPKPVDNGNKSKDVSKKEEKPAEK